MNLDEIKHAVNAGHRVHWKSPSYTVIKDSTGQYLIAYLHGTWSASYIGLTWTDGTTMNGNEADFYLV